MMTALVDHGAAERLAKEIADRIRSLPNATTEPVRAVRREYSKRIAKSPPGFVLSLAVRLLDTAGVPRFTAYELVKHHRGAAASLDRKKLELLGRGLNEWGDVDCFSCYLSGPAWREHQIPDDVVRRWARSRDRWWRRVALVSTVALNSRAQGGTGDAGRTLDICRLLVSDRDDMVVKAMSWALRELSKRDPKSVRDFLDEHQGMIAARVVREVRNKLTTGLKTPKKRFAS